MNDQREFQRENPRSTTYVKNGEFVKTSQEVMLDNEAKELHRCKILGIQRPYVKPLELIAYNSSSNKLVTRFIPNTQSLFNLMWNGTSVFCGLRRRTVDTDLLMDRIREMGLWLRLYHNSSHFPENSAQVVNNLSQMFKNKIDAIRCHSLLNSHFLDQVEKHFYPAIEDIVKPEYQKKSYVRFCRVHGDFIAYNIMVDPDWNTHILDFGDAHIGASFEDVARFYELLWAISKTGVRRKSVFSRAIRMFLNAYGLPEHIGNDPFFMAIRALNGIIHCIAEYTQRQISSYSVFTTSELQRITRASLTWISKEVGVPYSGRFFWQ